MGIPRGRKFICVFNRFHWVHDTNETSRVTTAYNSVGITEEGGGVRPAMYSTPYFFIYVELTLGRSEPSSSFSLIPTLAAVSRLQTMRRALKSIHKQ